MVQIKAKIIRNKKIKGNYWHCIFNAPLIAKEAKPGQFVNIKLSNNFKPFLRRPFSIYRIGSQVREFLPAGRHGASSRVKKSPPETIEILYEVIGPGTKILSDKKAGEYLDVIGPLGSGFSFNSRTCELKNSRTILVAGGIGAAPLVFLSGRIKAKDKIALIGARIKSQILCEKEFKNSGCDVKIATDDGCAGFKGKVTDLLRKVLRLAISGLPAGQADRQAGKRLAIYACGPKPMLKEICRISKEHKIPAQVSMEEHMSCGIGACLGCVVKTKEGLKRVCKEGPVFNAAQLIW